MSIEIGRHDATNAAVLHGRNPTDVPSRALCENIFTSLSRDSALRRDYVRRRWQGAPVCALRPAAGKSMCVAAGHEGFP